MCISWAGWFGPYSCRLTFDSGGGRDSLSSVAGDLSLVSLSWVSSGNSACVGPIGVLSMLLD